jgi:tRNA dimethylallyltransferase
MARLISTTWRMRLTGETALPLIVILGPTAVGKTGIAIDLAAAVHGEIVGADSRQIYRHMNIGTAKPTAEEQARAPHHLIDIVNPDDNLTLAEYQRRAYAIIQAIHRRGRVPLLVGGTGQYITAITEGWAIPEVPPNLALREELEAFAAEQGAEALHQRLAQVDPAAAARIHPNNIRRAIRALEVSLETGERISQLQRKTPPPYYILELGLTMNRQNLYSRADTRLDQMMARGFLDEVRELLDMGYDRRLPALSGLGYRQLAAHILDGAPLETALQETRRATRDFIRRQFTWFRGHDNGILWHNVDNITIQALIKLSMQWLEE